MRPLLSSGHSKVNQRNEELSPPPKRGEVQMLSPSIQIRDFLFPFPHTLSASMPDPSLDEFDPVGANLEYMGWASFAPSHVLQFLAP
ncbi:hypothetical protein KBB96_17115 [Luteolibacter ambystomatis]|uniref:Uncharacterized protein n=1 Tax=Luteolibacter ambystomatis TaxID=2824561 RepID=A0A975G883_9BACT|nr:hypothetical protein [Luteolibacter ambystomatis]QUE50571.1 hypothetical protein KBB96_17115 [Luteolibacter ambystomatis]